MTKPHCLWRRRVALLSSALFTATLLLALFLPTTAFAQDDGFAQLGPEGQAIAQAINDARSANGLGPLAIHPLLNQAAQNHVDDLIRNGMYGHYGSDGSNVRARVLRTGYASGFVSENWVTSGSTQGAMDWWMNDWIHRVNILDASWDEMGVGAGQVSNGYWIFVTDFANTDGKDTSIAVAPSQASATLAAAPETIPSEGSDYSVRAGDTLLAIGLRFGMEWQDIALANNIGESDVLQIGRKLRLPGLENSGIGGAVDVAEGGMIYTVSSGDTLSGIAGRYKVGWEEIAAANRLGEFTVLQIGMQLRLPGVEEQSTDNSKAVDVQTQAKIAEALATPVTPGANLPPAQGFGGTIGGAAYRVQAGDTLFSIAAKNGLTVAQLTAANGLDEESWLQIGQTLTLPGDVAAGAPVVFAATTPVPVAATRTVTVKPGDTVISIALRNNINWKTLLSVNGLNDNSLLQPGQVLTLP